jgi:elongation factor G
MARTPADAERMTHGLKVLTAEDPTISARLLPTGEVVVGAIGELQLEIVVDRLKREFAVSATIERPRIGYTETVTREADGEMKYQTRAPGQYAHVKLRVHPRERGSGYLFENNLIGAAIPAEYVPAVEAGIERALEAGVLAGYPVQDIKVVLHDGSWHDVDSTAAAFRIAAGLALQDALKKANPIVLEPLMRVLVTAPNEFKDAVLQSYAGRRVQPLRAVQQRETLFLVLRAPLAAMLGYAADLRERTLGRASVRMSFDTYEPLQPADDDGAHGVREPLHPRPSPRSGSIALPLDEA